MQKKIIIDTNIYIDIFNSGRHENLRNPFQYIAYLAHPVLHELWMGAKGKLEIKHLVTLQNEFIQLKRMIVPTVTTLVLVGKACHRLRTSGKLDPVFPKHYNDISIAALARQIGASVVTHNIQDFGVIQRAIEFNFEEP